MFGYLFFEFKSFTQVLRVVRKIVYHLWSLTDVKNMTESEVNEQSRQQCCRLKAFSITEEDGGAHGLYNFGTKTPWPQQLRGKACEVSGHSEDSAASVSINHSLHTAGTCSNFSLFYIHIENVWHISSQSTVSYFVWTFLWLYDPPVRIIRR